MTGCVTIENISVFCCAGADKTAIVASSIAVGGIAVGKDMVFLLATQTNLPMDICIIVVFFGKLVTCFILIAASTASRQASIGHGMLVLVQSTAAIFAACPMVNHITVPLFSCRVIVSFLMLTNFTDLFVGAFIHISETTVFVFAGSGDGLFIMQSAAIRQMANTAMDT